MTTTTYDLAAKQRATSIRLAILATTNPRDRWVLSREYDRTCQLSYRKP